MWFLLLFVISCLGNVCANPRDFEDSNCGYESCPLGKPGFINVHIIAHTHNDVGWLKTADQYFYGDKNNVQNAGVQYILDSVIDELEKDPNRRFIYVETSFFWRWWISRDEIVHQRVQNLVQNGRLEFVSGGWCMNDEAGAYYGDIIDQMTWGFRFLNDTFGVCGLPRVGWQIDPFGHSREQASLSAQMGFDGMFLGRIDYQDKLKRNLTKTMEFVWNASVNLGQDAQLFTVVLPNTYSPPPGFCFDVLCGDEPIMDNPRLKGYNVNAKVLEFLNILHFQSMAYRTNNLIITMGNDFNYQNGNTWFRNLDKLIKYVNKMANPESTTLPKINVFYSTPSCYLKALNDAKLNWTVKTDDFFPYASDPHAYWTGYFTSRPTFKGYTKVTNNLLQIGKQLSVFSGTDNEENLAVLKRFQGDAQHHDAISGTAKQAVADDYAESLSIGQTKVEDAINNAYSVLMARNTSLRPPRQTFCHGLNVSYCVATEKSDSFVVTLYNPLGHRYLREVRIPVTGTQYIVKDPEGYNVSSQVVPIPDEVMINPEKQGKAQNDLVFQVELEPCGFSSYFVQKIPGFKRIRQRNIISLKSDDLSISNEFLSVAVEGKTGLLKSVTDLNSNKTYNIQQNFLYYNGMIGNNSKSEWRASGAYIFRPNGTSPHPVSSVVKAVKFEGEIVQEIHQKFNDSISQVIRLFANNRFVELEWMVGPIPVNDGCGKEIISQFKTDFETGGLFYTDSNGREILERRRDYRPTWKLNISENIAGNYYPVNSRIFIRDLKKNSQLTIVTDRSQGGSSIQDGIIELMVHRRLLHDDAFGVDEALNETGIDNKGLRVRGKHWLVVGSITETAILHRKLALKANFPPLISIAPLNGTIENWIKSFKTTYSALKLNLPVKIHLLTLEPWKNGTALIRLEYFVERNETETSEPVEIDMKDMFADIEISEAKETTLGGNVWLNDKHRMSWQIDHNVLFSLSKLFEDIPRHDSGTSLLNITMYPMQIRTFIVKLIYKRNIM